MYNLSETAAVNLSRTFPMHVSGRHLFLWVTATHHMCLRPTSLLHILAQCSQDDATAVLGGECG